MKAAPNLSEKYTFLGWVSKTHGLKGNIIIKLVEEILFQTKIIPAIFIEMQPSSFIPYKVEKFQVGQNQTLNIKLEGIDTCEQGQALKQKKMWVEKKYDKQLFAINSTDLVGFKIQNIPEVECYIEQIVNMGINKVFITTINKKEVILPAGEDLIEKIDHKKKEIFLKIPPGLIDIYLQ